MLRKSMKELKQNNQGSTLVLVLVLVAFITMLSVTVTTVSMSNLRMKTMNKESTKAFYTAEDAVDEIYAALGKVSMECIQEAYTDEISSVVMVDANRSVTDNLIYNRNFRYGYITKLVDALGITATENPSSFEVIYNSSNTAEMERFVTLLNSYLEDEDGLKVKSVASVEVNSSEKSTNPLDVSNLLNNYRLSFRDCVVEFNNEDQYLSNITFDGTLGMPDTVLNFVALDTSELTAFTRYALVGSAGILQNEGTGTINGSAYAGRANGIRIAPNASIVANGNADAGILISAGDVTLGATDNQSASSLVVSSNAELWTENIMMTGAFSRLTISGRAYVNDDLHMDGNDTSATLSGAYYGYGYSTVNSSTHVANSAILLNGQRASLNMGNIQTLVIAGRSYIDYTNKMLTASFAGTDIDTSTVNPYKTGNSVGYIGAQEIYLVPATFMQDRNYSYGNPTTTENASIVRNMLISTFSGNTFFGYDYLLASEPYRAITIDGQVHFYLNFRSDEDASNYVRLVLDDTFYETVKSAKLETVAENQRETVATAFDTTRNYVKDLLSLNLNQVSSYITALNQNANIFTNGALVLADATEIGLQSNAGDAYRRSDSVLYGTQYATLKKVLMKDYDNAAAYDADASIFANFVDVTALEEYIDLESGNVNPIVSGNMILYADQRYDDTTLVIDDAFTSCNTGIIVCDGNVRVSKNFTGTILASGTITLDAGVTVSNDGSDTIKNLIEAHEDFAKIFMAYGEHQQGSTADNQMGQIAYGDLVTFSAWRKSEAATVTE